MLALEGFLTRSRTNLAKLSRLDQLSIVVFLLVFSFTTYVNYHDSSYLMTTDDFAVLLYVRQICEEGSLLPTNFYYATEYLVSVLYYTEAVFYSIFGSLKLAYATGVCIWSVVYAFLFIKLCRQLGSKIYAIFFGLSLSFTLYWDFLYWNFMYGCVYLGVTNAIIFTMYVWTKKDRSKILTHLSFLVAFWTGLSSIRMIGILYAPLLFLEILRNLIKKYKSKQTEWRSVIFPSKLLVLNLVAAAVAHIVFGKVLGLDIATSHIGFFKNSIDIIPTIYNVILTNLCINHGAFYGMIYVLAWVVAYTCILIGVIRHYFTENQKRVLIFMALTSGLTFFELCLINMTPATRYFLQLDLLIIFSLVFFASHVSDLIAVIYFLFLVILGTSVNQYKAYNYVETFLRSSGDIAKVSQSERIAIENSKFNFNFDSKYVKNYIQQSNAARIYMTYWEGGPIRSLSNGEIDMCYFAPFNFRAGVKNRLSPFHWLNQRSIYSEKLDNPTTLVILTQQEMDSLADDDKQRLHQSAVSVDSFDGYYKKFYAFNFDHDPFADRNGK